MVASASPEYYGVINGFVDIAFIKGVADVLIGAYLIYISAKGVGPLKE